MDTVGPISSSIAVPELTSLQGSSLIIAPPNEAQAWWSQVPGSQPVAGSDGYYSYPCDSPPSVCVVLYHLRRCSYMLLQVAFSFSNKAWKVSPSTFNLGRLEDGSDQCVGAVVGVDIQIPVWILGVSHSFVVDHAC